MTSKEKLLEFFNTLGHNVDDENVIKKCLDLCEKHDINEEILVDQWFSYVTSLEDDNEPAPTIDNLNDFDNHLTEKQLNDNSDSDNDEPTTIDEQPRDTTDLSRLAIFNSIKKYDENDEDDILAIYGVAKPVASSTEIKKDEIGDEDDDNSQMDIQFKSPKIDRSGSPAAYTPKTQSPGFQRGTIVSGKILNKFGKDVESWKNKNIRNVDVIKSDVPHVPDDILYMYSRHTMYVEIIQNHITNLGDKIISAWPTNDDTNNDVIITPNVNEKSQGLIRTFGRISCDDIGKLNESSIVLENIAYKKNDDEYINDNNDDVYNSGIIHLDLKQLPNYSIFPGQVVAVEGRNPTSDLFIVTKMLSACKPPASPLPKLKEQLQIIVASGPFTYPDVFDIEPLLKLMEYVVENEPNVLILCGPFVDDKHPVVKASAFDMSYEEVFQKMIEQVMNYVKGKSTKVVIVSSMYDVHHHNIYPTPEFYIPEHFSIYENLVLMPDPCMMDIEGLIIGTTTVDIIKHLGAEEISYKMQGTDRLGRLADHILSQSSFYPLQPPSSEINYDVELWNKYAMIHKQPHILVLPSTMRHFCRWSSGTFIINPERLAKGTYSRLNIRPPVDDKWLPDCIDCEILKI